MTSEKVWVVRRADLFQDADPPRGFGEQGLAFYLEAARTKGFFADREEAEVDPSMKQIIPYAVITWSDQVFMIRRTSAQREARLHHKVSIGIGGHVNLDGPPAQLLEAGLKRELGEEVYLRAPHVVRCAGYVNDESNPVGQVHFGIVYRVDMERPEVSVRERELMEGGFVPAGSLRAHEDGMESWSRFLVEPLTRWLLSPEA